MIVTPRTPGFNKAHVTIDGQDVRGLRCFEANDDEGYIRCYFHTQVAKGMVRLYSDQDGRPRSYMRHGTVVITMPAPDVIEEQMMRRAQLFRERGIL